jgi:hypothetical protein
VRKRLILRIKQIKPRSVLFRYMPPSDPVSVVRRLNATARRRTHVIGRGVRLGSYRPLPRPKQRGGLIRPRQTAVLTQRDFLGRGPGRRLGRVASCRRSTDTGRLLKKSLRIMA